MKDMNLAFTNDCDAASRAHMPDRATVYFCGDSASDFDARGSMPAFF